MGKILRADNRTLTQGQPYSYLSYNYASGQGSIVVENSNSFAANQYILLSEFGPETSEMIQINTVTSATHTLVLKTNTKFSHSESTKVTVIPFNQVKFYHASAVSYVGVVASSTLLSTQDVQADNIFTQYEDASNSTGFGWFLFYNSTTTITGLSSNAIPYAGTAITDVKYIFDRVLSQINNKEKRLISNDDLFAWLNEGYTRVRNSFNLVNRTDEISTDTITPSAQETALDDDFFKIVSVYDESAKEYLKPIEIKEIERYKNISSGQTPRYYVRRDAGTNYIGIVPVQDGTKNFTIWQETKITRLTKYSDSILLPDGNVYMLINFMLYKCYSKLGRGDALAFLELFENDTKEIKQQSALKIESGDDRWEIDRSCNI